MKKVHLNCDLGEGGSFDAQLMPLISACNIACGGHAGSTESMRQTIRLALEHGVEIGAHPSYPDRENFGRRSMELSAEELRQTLLEQIQSLQQLAEAEGTKLQHVKPHGALYHDVAKDERIAETFLNVLKELDENLRIFTPETSILSRLVDPDTSVVFEAFADRNYNPDHSLVSRERPDALITDKELVFQHLYSMVSRGEILCENGQKAPCKAETFCLHSDTPGSVEILRYLDKKLAEKGYKIAGT